MTRADIDFALSDGDDVQMVILETKNMGFIDGTLPVFDYSYWFVSAARDKICEECYDSFRSLCLPVHVKCDNRGPPHSGETEQAKLSGPW